MKKALVLLLILAVAGGVAFAQDTSFSVGGEVRVGTRFEFESVSDPIIHLDKDTYGEVTFDWELGDYNVGINFTTNPFGGEYEDSAATPFDSFFEIGLYGEYEGDDFGFKAEVPILRTEGDLVADQFVFGNSGPTTLWGYWWFLDQTLLFDVSYVGGRDDGLWAVSDLVGGNVGHLDGKSGVRFNYVGVPGLNAGVFFDGEYVFADVNDDIEVVDIFKNMGIGVNYDLNFMAISTEVALNKDHPAGSRVNASVYLGVLFEDLFPGFTLKADLALRGLAQFGDRGRVDLGVGFEFDAAPLTVGLNLRARDIMDNLAPFTDFGGDIEVFGGDFGGGRVVTVDPYASFAINDKLWAGFDLGFYVGLGRAASSKNAMAVAFKPKLAYNFLGDGATDDPSNGMVFEYTLVYDFDDGEVVHNNFFIGYRWTF